MTEVIEKQAEEDVIKTVCKTECPVWNIHSGCTIPRKDCNYTSNRLKGFINGAKWGMEHAIQWHDLRKNPDDLPKNWQTVLAVTNYDGYVIVRFIQKVLKSEEQLCWMSINDSELIFHNIIAWCELPQFKE